MVGDDAITRAPTAADGYYGAAIGAASATDEASCFSRVFADIALVNEVTEGRRVFSRHGAPGSGQRRFSPAGRRRERLMPR
jgi:hypothetical protein